MIVSPFWYAYIHKTILVSHSYTLVQMTTLSDICERAHKRDDYNRNCCCYFTNRKFRNQFIVLTILSGFFVNLKSFRTFEIGHRKLILTEYIRLANGLCASIGIFF